jgi:hypothetical protein
MLTFNDHTARQPQVSRHLSHLEDVIFEGPQGVKLTHDLLTEFGKILDGDVSSAVNVSVKWDGAPAIVFGPDPEDNAFFVGTKAVFNRIPKKAKTHDQITAMYGDEYVAKILHQALDELPKLHPDKVMQGDLLFSRKAPTDAKGAVRAQVIDGVAYFTFQPNTILYAVEGDSALGRAVTAAVMGIALHTVYSGTGTILSGFKAKNMSPLTYAGLRKDPNILTLDAHFDDVSGTVTFTAQERSDFQLAHTRVIEAYEALNMSVYSVIQEYPELRTNLGLYVNWRVRNGINIPANASAFLEFQSRLMKVNARSLQTERGREEMMEREYIYRMAVLRQGFEELFQLHNAVVRAKEIILQKLNQTSQVRTFLPTQTGFKVTNPEGFVAIAHSGEAVKLVDRLEFSRANFHAQKWS